MTLTREGFIDFFPSLYKKFDEFPVISFSYLPIDHVCSEVVPYPEDIVAYNEAMQDLKQGKNIISLDEFKKKYA